MLEELTSVNSNNHYIECQRKNCPLKFTTRRKCQSQSEFATVSGAFFSYQKNIEIEFLENNYKKAYFFSLESEFFDSNIKEHLSLAVSRRTLDSLSLLGQQLQVVGSVVLGSYLTFLLTSVLFLQYDWSDQTLDLRTL